MRVIPIRNPSKSQVHDWMLQQRSRQDVLTHTNARNCEQHHCRAKQTVFRGNVECFGNV